MACTSFFIIFRQTEFEGSIYKSQIIALWERNTYVYYLTYADIVTVHIEVSFFIFFAYTLLMGMAYGSN